MKIELKKFEVSARMSEETCCYSADLWVDGKKAGFAGNAGHGGCDEVHIFDPQLSKRIAAAVALMPEVPFGFEGSEGKTYKRDLDCFLQELAFRRLEIKELKSAIRAKAKKLYARYEGTTYADDTTWTVLTSKLGKTWREMLEPAAARHGRILRCLNQELEDRLAGLLAEPDFITLPDPAPAKEAQPV